MKSRALRYALLMLFAAAIAGAAYTCWNEESQGSQAARAARAFDERARTLSRSMLEIKSAQPGYVAAGQGEDFWVARVDALIASAREGLSSLRSAGHAAAQDDLDAAAAAFRVP